MIFFRIFEWAVARAGDNTVKLSKEASMSPNHLDLLPQANLGPTLTENSVNPISTKNLSREFGNWSESPPPPPYWD